MQRLNGFERELLEKEQRAQPQLREFKQTVAGHVRDEMRGQHTYDFELRAGVHGQETAFDVTHVNEASANAYRGRINAAIKKYEQALADAGWNVTTEHRKYESEVAGPVHHTILRMSAYGTARPSNAPAEFGQDLHETAQKSQKRSSRPSIPAVLRDLELFQQRVQRAIKAANKSLGAYGPLGTGKKFNIGILTQNSREAALLHRRISDIAAHHQSSLNAAGWRVKLTPWKFTGKAVWLDIEHARAKPWHWLPAAQPEGLRKALSEIKQTVIPDSR
ncbi:hypothetical protein HYV43_06090 [Candidatus Micrarchaeota archaeon]|nr:hypothetical protein [Candidatus Micrarchaeota archaeon]